MLSKNKIKYIHSLGLRKNRLRDGVFVAEGPKLVGELLKADKALTIIATDEWMRKTEAEGQRADETIEVSEDELRRASLQQHPQEVIAVFRQQHHDIHPEELEDKLSLMLDGVQDPGNLGTIVRIADWFGIDTVICSPDTADIYNPKAIQSTMGSTARVNVVYTELTALLNQLTPDFPIYGTMLESDSLYEQPLTQNGIIIMGNEGNGMSRQTRAAVSRGLRIPSFPPGRATAESLNVGVATAIVCAEFRRQSIKQQTND